jgi:hypothetical protein
MKCAGLGLMMAVLGASTVAARGEGVPSTTAPVATKIPENPDPSRYLFEDGLSPGMKGYGLTVMHGGKIEKFDVEIIDVVRNFTAGTNAILVKCSGLGLEHSGIIAGMSGSPVFVQGKMIGAVAFGWGMSKDAIGGVQPIRQMLAIKAEKPRGTAATGGGRWESNGYFAKQAAALPGWRILTHSISRQAGPPMVSANAGANTMGMHPLLSPLMVGGASAETIATLRELFAGTNLYPMQSGAAGATPDPTVKELGGIGELKPGGIKLEPGSAIAVPLVTGDMDLSAIGTVTEVRGDKVYAFGHAFNGDGATDLPIATSYIYTVLPNLNISFKMGTSLATVGTLVTDEETGIVGVQGKAPPTVPVTFAVKYSDGAVDSTYHYQLVPAPRMLPELLTAIVSDSLIAHRALPREFTARIKGELQFTSAAGPVTVHLDTVATTQTFNPNIAMLPVVVLADNPFEDLRLKQVAIETTVDNDNRSGEITSVTVNRSTAAPGDEIQAVVTVTPYHGPAVQVPISLHVPVDAKDGDYQLSVGSSAMALEEETAYAPQHFDPQNVEALAKAVQHILDFRPEHLYATLVMNVSGATVGGHEHANLPGSRLALYASDRRNDTTPLFEVAKAEVDAGSVIADGGQTFSLTVDRHADRRYYEPKTDQAANAGQNGEPHGPHIPVTAPAPSSAPADPDN